MKLDGKPLTDYTAEGADDWQPYGGDWSVQDGEYVTTPARDAKTLLRAGRGLRDFTFEATITLGPAGDAGLMFRVTKPEAKLDDYHGCYIRLKARVSRDEDAEEPPPSPVASTEPTELVELIPVGSAKRRVSDFPVLGAD